MGASSNVIFEVAGLAHLHSPLTKVHTRATSTIVIMNSESGKLVVVGAGAGCKESGTLPAMRCMVFVRQWCSCVRVVPQERPPFPLFKL